MAVTDESIAREPWVRMSDAEGLMWRLEKDPHLASVYANVTILDRPLDFERLRRRMERAAIVVPRLRQRVQPSPVSLTPPSWVDDADFDIDRHVRHIALPAPGTLRQLFALATLMTVDPFDRNRPLWEFVVVDGLKNGKGVLIQKIHHAVTDGEGGVQLSLQYLDLQRDAPPPPPPKSPVAAADDLPPIASPGSNVVEDLFAGAFRFPMGLLRQARHLLADPAQIPAATLATMNTVKGVITQLSETDKARSPLWSERSLGRHLEVLRVPIAPARAAAKRLGGTLNTAFITAAATAAGAYHREFGQPVEQLRASMAISTRKSADEANAFSLARLLVPTGDMAIAERFAAIEQATGQAKASSATASLEVLASVAATLPTSLVTRLARQQAQTVDFATSNVRAARIPVYIAGAMVQENYPIGPLLGVAFNLTLLSYNGSLDMGLNVDTAAVEDPPLLRKLTLEAFRALAKAR